MTSAPTSESACVASAGGAVVGVPPSLTSLVGPDEETEALVGLLTGGEARLVNLVGPGGVGKTRLAARVAVEAAPAFADGVRFVQLAAESDPAAVPGSVAPALGVRDDQAGGVLPALIAALRDRHTLLVLDNFEQVVDGGLRDAAQAGLARCRSGSWWHQVVMTWHETAPRRHGAPAGADSSRWSE